MKSFKEQQGIDESPLVMYDIDIVDTLFKTIRRDIQRDHRNKNDEKNWPKLQVLAKLAGYGITKKGQDKNKTFRYDLKK